MQERAKTIYNDLINTQKNKRNDFESYSLIQPSIISRSMSAGDQQSPSDKLSSRSNKTEGLASFPWSTKPFERDSAMEQQ